MPKELDFKTLREHINYLIDEMPRELYAGVRAYEKYRMEETRQIPELEELSRDMTKQRTKIKNIKREMTIERKKSETPTQKYDKLFREMCIELMKAEYLVDELKFISIEEIGDDLTIGIL